MHAESVQKYIIFHDTAAMPELKQAVNEFISDNTEWNIVEDFTDNVGYTVIGRKQ